MQDRKIEYRASGEKPATVEGRKVSGLAVPYSADSLDLGGFIERFLPGSTADTIKGNRIEMWLYHDRTKPLGSQASGSLRLWETDSGLNYENELPENNTDADNCRSLLTPTETRNAIIGGTSFGFWVSDPSGERWFRDGEKIVREVIKADIDHISPVVSPAYPQTTAALRSLAGAITSPQAIDTADRYGIDLAKLASLMLSAKRNLTLSAADVIEAQKAITLLQSTLDTPKLKSAIDRAAQVLL